MWNPFSEFKENLYFCMSCHGMDWLGWGLRRYLSFSKVSFVVVMSQWYSTKKLCIGITLACSKLLMLPWVLPCSIHGLFQHQFDRFHPLSVMLGCSVRRVDCCICLSVQSIMSECNYCNSLPKIFPGFVRVFAPFLGLFIMPSNVHILLICKCNIGVSSCKCSQGHEASRMP